MAKAIVLQYRDGDEGATANDLILRANVLFVGAGVPDGLILSEGQTGNGVPISLSLTGMSATAYSNAVEAGCIAEATRLGITLTNTDVLMPSYTRGT